MHETIDDLNTRLVLLGQDCEKMKTRLTNITAICWAQSTELHKRSSAADPIIMDLDRQIREALK